MTKKQRTTSGKVGKQKKNVYTYISKPYKYDIINPSNQHCKLYLNADLTIFKNLLNEKLKSFSWQMEL